MTTTSSVRLYSLSLNTLRNWTIATIFIVGNILLPQLVHLIPGGGERLLPIYLLTLIAAYKYGWRAGLLTAVASPVINSLLGMPPMSALPIILLKSVVLAIAASEVAHRSGRVSIIGIAVAVLLSQVVGCGVEWIVERNLLSAVADLRIGLPGILLQIFGGWAIIRFLLRR